MSDQQNALASVMPQIQSLMPYAQLQGRELIELLEITTGKSIFEEEPHWYSKTRLLPVANLTSAEKGFMIWTGFSEIWAMLRDCNPFSESALTQLDEYQMSLVGQCSRAYKGAERERMTTTGYRISVPEQEGEQQKKGGWRSWFGGGK